MFKFKNGQRLKDKVTGFTGIVTARIEYINGCIQYCIKPSVGIDNKMPQCEYIDQGQLEFVDDGVQVESTPTGGPQADAPRH